MKKLYLSFGLLGLALSCFAQFTPKYANATALMDDMTQKPISIPFKGIDVSPWQQKGLSPAQIRDINSIMIFDQWTYNEVTKQSVQPQFVFPSLSNLKTLATYLKTKNNTLVDTFPTSPTLAELTDYCQKQYTAQQTGKTFSRKQVFEKLKTQIFSIQDEYTREIKRTACTMAFARNMPPELLISMFENETAYNPNYVAEPGLKATVGLGQIRFGDNKNVSVPGVIGNLERFGHLQDDVVTDSMLFDPFVNIGVTCQKLVFDYFGQNPGPTTTNKWSVALTLYGPVSGYVEKTKKNAEIVISRPYLLTDGTKYFRDLSVLASLEQNLFGEDNASVKAYPNPVSEMLQTTTSPDGQAYNLAIRNTYGQIVYQSYESKTKHEILLNGFSNGIYFLEIGNKIIKFTLNK